VEERGRRVLGLDLGGRRIGLALSDEVGLTAQPFDVLRRGRRGEEIAALREIVEANDVGRVVVGLPLNMDGSRGAAALDCERYAAELEESLGVPVVLWDERLSTVEAERPLIEAGVRREKRRGTRDMVAAALVLQAYLDRRRGGGK